MTQSPSLSKELEAVLDVLLDEFETPSPQAIAVYSSRYPHFRAELLSFGATWTVEEFLPDPKPLSKEQEDALEARAQSFLHNALFERAAAMAAADMPAEVPAAAVSPVAAMAAVSLAQLARDQGRKLSDVAEQTGIPLPWMSELNGKAFLPETIPRGTIARLASAIGVAFERIVTSLAGPVTIQPSMAFLATSKPAVSAQKDFAEIVRASDLAPEIKAALLEEA